MSGQRLFISHASADAAVAEQIVAYLEANGVACWIASRDIPPQSIYAEEITKGIEECDACAVIVSEAANKSGAIKRELELASHHNKSFIPIRIDGAEPGRGLDYYLRNTQWIDYRRDRERALDRIVAHVTGALRPAPSPARLAAAPSYATYEPETETPKRSGPGVAIWVGGAVVAVALVIWGVNQFGGQNHESADTGAVPLETRTEAGAPDNEKMTPTVQERAAAQARNEEVRAQRSQAPTDPMVGVWRYGEYTTFIVRANGTFTAAWTGNSSDGTWTRSGDVITLRFPPPGDIFVGTISGDRIAGLAGGDPTGQTGNPFEWTRE